MTCMSDLSQDLVVEILSRLPKTCLGALRCTCKGWNALSKDQILCTGESKQQFMGFMMMNHRLCSMRFDLHRILNVDGEDLVSILMYQVEISKVFYCAGLLLCVNRDMSTLVVWNPYLGQTRWIKTTTTTTIRTMFVLGYDKNKNHKILSFDIDNQGYCDIYDFKTNSWRSLTFIASWDIICHCQAPWGVSVNGNTYFCTREIIEDEDDDDDEDSDSDDEATDFLICFDFTEENLEISDFVSCVKEEKLAAIYVEDGTTSRIIEIWVTSKIETNAVSWIPFLKVDIEPLAGPERLDFDGEFDSFFIDEEKKLAVVFALDGDRDASPYNRKAYIIGEDIEAHCSSFLCSSSYVPSLVQINQTEVPKSRETKKKRKRN
ncbi:hypothetical protein CARUB_v10015616mg [Capsella rubella]|uniref:F-box domain-containing protein n=1 Tax=Capsella rubella TaxID=81985 RepID=R0HRD3_9BRAS|nr:hypothetical protein CARUB_v10015616mg [Capsella rubella]